MYTPRCTDEPTPLSYGRPVARYTDRESIFEYQSNGRGVPDGLTQFGRALRYFASAD
jgi:hypothetical protein